MSVKFINLENLSDFWSNAKEYISNERKEIEDQLYNWQKTEKASMVQCEPVPNSELHPVVNFSFTETLPAEGEKGPENTSTITGVNSINVTRCGKNIVSLPFADSTNTNNGITYTNNGDGSITINGTATANSYFIFRRNIYLHAGAKLSINAEISGTDGEGVAVQIVSPDNLYPIIWQYLNSQNTIKTIPEDGYVILRLFIGKNTTLSNAVIKPQYEFGDAKTDYEVPILASEVDYLLPFNNTYYGGFIDLFTGLMTVTWWGESLPTPSTVDLLPGYVRVNGFFTKAHTGSKGTSVDSTVISNYGDNAVYCRYSAGNKNYSTLLSYSILGIDEQTATSETALAAVISFLSEHPCFVAYKIYTPFTVQLTPQQIKSLSSLEGTSKRINTIYTDADSVQVEYQKYVGIDSTLDSDSVNAIQNKTVNSALNTKVSLSGDETINGTKTFSNTINGSITGDAGTVAGHIVSKDVPVNAVFTDTTYDPATQSTAGLMSASDKVKLDAVGSVFSFKGSVTDSSSLPASDNVNGDAYLAEDTGHVHVYDGTSFVDIGVWAGIPSATDAQIDALFED